MNFNIYVVTVGCGTGGRTAGGYGRPGGEGELLERRCPSISSFLRDQRCKQLIHTNQT